MMKDVIEAGTIANDINHMIPDVDKASIDIVLTVLSQFIDTPFIDNVLTYIARYGVGIPHFLPKYLHLATPETMVSVRNYLLQLGGSEELVNMLNQLIGQPSYGSYSSSARRLQQQPSQVGFPLPSYTRR